MCAQPAMLMPRVTTSQMARAKFVTASTALLEMEEPSVKVGKKINICTAAPVNILKINQVTLCNVKEAAHRDKPTANQHPLVQFSKTPNSSLTTLC